MHEYSLTQTGKSIFSIEGFMAGAGIASFSVCTVGIPAAIVGIVLHTLINIYREFKKVNLT